MGYRFAVAGALLAAVGLAVLATVGVSADDPGERRAIAGGATVELCLPADHSALADLRTGARRAVLVVHSLRPAAGGSGGLRVRLPATGAESRIGFYPAGAFDETSGVEPRRYFLPSARDAAAGPLCYEVAFDDGIGGEVIVSLEVSTDLRE